MRIFYAFVYNFCMGNKSEVNFKDFLDAAAAVEAGIVKSWKENSKIDDSTHEKITELLSTLSTPEDLALSMLNMGRSNRKPK